MIEGRRCACREYDCTNEPEERFSLGLPAGWWCDPHWATSGYRKEGREGFDPADCGETYEPEPCVGGFDDEW